MNEVYHRPPRAQYKEFLREECDERKKAWDQLSTMEKIASLDERLGPNVGATKQRARLKSQLEAEGETKAKKQRLKDVEATENANKK